jgi:hypothetical protein
MATFNWSSLTTGQIVAFDRLVIIPRFDLARRDLHSISARDRSTPCGCGASPVGPSTKCRNGERGIVASERLFNR